MKTYIRAYRTSRRQVAADPHQPAFWRKRKPSDCLAGATKLTSKITCVN